jgi:autotransporter strand-loop-strand O-heptosyltransferase
MNNQIYKDLRKNRNNIRLKPNVIDISFHKGAKVSISGKQDIKYRVEFINTDTGNIEYKSVITPGMFASPYKKYAVNWEIIVSDDDLGDVIKSERFDPKDKIVYFDFDTPSIGDTISWVPQVKRYQEITDCKVLIKTFHNDLFKDQYPEWDWIYPGNLLKPHYASYSLGYFLGENRFEYTPKDPRLSPLGDVICQIIGIPYEEAKPKVSVVEPEYPVAEEYVCICTESTAGAKYWHFEMGWQTLVNMIKEKLGLSVVVVQKEKSNLDGVIDLSGSVDLRERAGLISKAKCFIGLPSGMSWLAWSLDVPVVMISGFSQEWAEFTQNNYRVMNKSVCHGCWNNTEYTFDKGDWWWCPVNKGTEKYFECTRKITPDDVFTKISEALGINN